MRQFFIYFYITLFSVFAMAQMDANDPRSNGNGGWSSGGLHESNNRSATNQATNNESSWSQDQKDSYNNSNNNSQSSSFGDRANSNHGGSGDNDRNGSQGMDRNDPRSNGQGGWANAAYIPEPSIGNSGARSATNQLRNNSNNWTDKEKVEYIDSLFSGANDRDNRGISSSPRPEPRTSSAISGARPQPRPVATGPLPRPSAMDPVLAEAVAPLPNSSRDAILRGFQNAEFGYAPQEQSQYYDRDTYQYDWHMDFYTGTHNYYQGRGLSPDEMLDQPVATGPAHESFLDSGKDDHDVSDRQTASLIDQAAREGRVIVSTPAHPITGDLRDNMNPVQRYGLENSLLVIGDRNALASITAPKEAAGGLPHEVGGTNYYGAFGTAQGGLTIVVNGELGSTDAQNFDRLVHHELYHAGVQAVTNELMEGLQTGEISGRDHPKVFSAALLMAGQHIVEIGNSFETINGEVIPDSTVERINEVDPEFLEKDKYFGTISEMSAYRNEGLNRVNLGALIHQTYNNPENPVMQDLTRQEADQIAGILHQSQVLDFAEKAIEDYVVNKEGN